MAAAAQQYNGFKDPFAASHQQSFGSYKLGSKKGMKAGGFGDSLAVQYELHDQQPYYQADHHDKGYEYKQDNVPIARNNAGQLFVPSFDARNDKSNRIDSVFDAYVDMYAEDEEEEDGSGEDLRGTAAGRTRQEDLEPYESHAQSDTPWDERGKSGLYGGGGRGADDRETGWVRDYAFSPAPPVSGYEEDLRFDNDDGEELQPQSSHDQHRQSSETSGSSTGPLTPTNGVDFSSARELALRQTQATARSSPRLQEQPIHTVDPARIKKKTIGAAIPTPSAPMPALASSGVESAREDRPRVQRKTTFKLIGRSKKPPTISAPILPEGFVESLGMETFPLYPGVKPPQHALLSPSLKEDRASTPSASSPRPAAVGGLVPASPRIRSPPTRKAAPRPKHVPTRAEGSTPPLRDRPISPPVIAQVREQHFSTRGYDDEDEPQPRHQQQQQYTRPINSPPRSSPSRSQQLLRPPQRTATRQRAATPDAAAAGCGGSAGPLGRGRCTTSPARARSASNSPLLTPSPPAADYGSTTPTTSPGDDAQPSPNSSEVDDLVPNLLGWIWGGQCTLIGLVRDSYIVLGLVLFAKLIISASLPVLLELNSALPQSLADMIDFFFTGPPSAQVCTDCGVVQRDLLYLFFVVTMWISGCSLCPIGLILVFLSICVPWMMLAVYGGTPLLFAGSLIGYYLQHILQGVKLAFLTNAPPSRRAIATLLATPSTNSWTLVYVDSTVYYLVRWAQWQKRWVRLADEEEELDKDAEEDGPDKP
uniref:BY PROTMAP: gi/342319862/gb/EGU11807.1/ Proteophosphoglycan 5 [Rhodotorula glutinis ATCC 204091] n=1 Tax=Rhodotorula toruloides TaxID=5286 RepID=A0A0K3CFF4_RHOTO